MNSSTTFANWSRASRELGFEFISPFSFTYQDKRYDSFAYLPEFGSPQGLIIIVNCDRNILEAANAQGYAYSCLSEGDGSYNVQSFVDTLNDWGWACVGKPAPSWYTGTPWADEQSSTSGIHE